MLHVPVVMYKGVSYWADVQCNLNGLPFYDTARRTKLTGREGPIVRREILFNENNFPLDVLSSEKIEYVRENEQDII